MKVWTILTSLFFVFVLNTVAQNSFWGVTAEGGDYGQGVIFKTDNDGNNFEVKFSVPIENDARTASKYTQLTEFSNTGLLYGVTKRGGVGDGVLFQLNSITGEMETMYAFNRGNCKSPEAPLSYDEITGKLYGTTVYSQADGIYSDGTGGALFEFNPTGKSFKVLHKFNVTNGERPYGKVLIKGNYLYGTTSRGGANGKGVLFKYDLTTELLTVIHNFEGGSDGEAPFGGLTEVDGVLYGATSAGGAKSCGVIYAYNIQTKTYETKKSFGGAFTDGSYMTGDFVKDGAMLYAVTSGDLTKGTREHGNIVSYNTETNALIQLYKFEQWIQPPFLPDSAGVIPTGQLIKDGNNLIGILTTGLISTSGTVFTYNLETDKLSSVPFSITEGDIPAGSLQKTSAGKMIGFYETNSESANGGLYEYKGEAGLESILTFRLRGDGAAPVGSLTRSTNGYLYGVMSEGGENEGLAAGGIQTGGTLFKFDPKTETFENKHQFSSGSVPNGSMLMVGPRVLYGLSERGGENDMGYVYKYNTYTGEFTIVASFTGSNGKYPKGGLTKFKGALYGLTNESNGGDGAIFKIIPEEFNGNGEITILKNLSATLQGGNPYGSLCVYNNKLYALMYTGPGAESGNIISFDGETEYEPLINIDKANSGGGNPYGSLTVVGSKLYGTAHGSMQDPYKFGSLFEFDPAASIPEDKLLPAENIKHNFTGNVNPEKRGAKPLGKITLGDNGLLYGLTSQVNFSNDTVRAVMYEFNPATSEYKSLNILQGNAGEAPGRNAELSLVCNTEASIEYSVKQNKLTATENDASYQWYRVNEFFELSPVTDSVRQSLQPGRGDTSVYVVEVTKNGCANISDTVNFKYTCETEAVIVYNKEQNTLKATLDNAVYQWYKVGEGDELIELIDSVYQQMQLGKEDSGTYRVEVWKGGCANISDTTAFSYYSVDVPEPIATVQNAILSVYPNPANYQIQIKGEQQIVNAQVIDLSGKDVSADVEFDLQGKQINIQKLNKGIYFIRFTLRENKMQTIRFVKR